MAHPFSRLGTRALSLLLSCCMTATLFCSALAVPAWATTQAELEKKKQELQSQLNQEKQELASIQNEKSSAEQAKASLENQSTLIQSQISVLLDQISDTQVQVMEKQNEVTAKQGEIDERWADYKARMAAMQQLHDGGAVAMLSNCSSLYELLTFNTTLQQISEKDTEVLGELETARQELAAQQQELEETQAQLESQQAQLESKQNELAQNIQEQDATITSAQAAEQAQSAVVQEVEKKLNAAAAELDTYIRNQNKQYSGSVSGTCSLDFICPVYYSHITTRYGSNGHTGVDLAAAANTPIYAIADGVVTIAASHYSYGNYVSVYHGADENGNTYASLYAHMIQQPSVSVGQSVKKGDLLGYVGNTGYSFGYHLHLELRVNGSRTNPLNYVPT